WRFDRADDTVEAIFSDGRWVGVDGRPVSALAGSRVSLWHPAEASPRRRAAWSAFVARTGISQPFRQGDREVFLREVDDGPDRMRCMRFAGRVVRQQQFAALARERSWEYTLQGPYHSFDRARLRLRSLGLVAELHLPHLDPYPDPPEPVDAFVSLG